MLYLNGEKVVYTSYTHTFSIKFFELGLATEIIQINSKEILIMMKIILHKNRILGFLVIVTLLLNGCESGSNNKSANTARDPLSTGTKTFISEGNYSMRRVANFYFSSPPSDIVTSLMTGEIDSLEPEDGALYSYDKDGKLTKFELYRFRNPGNQAYNEDGDVIYELMFEFSTNELFYNETSYSSFDYESLALQKTGTSEVTSVTNNLTDTLTFQDSFFHEAPDQADIMESMGSRHHKFNTNGFVTETTETSTHTLNNGQTTESSNTVLIVRNDMEQVEYYSRGEQAQNYVYDPNGRLQYMERLSPEGQVYETHNFNYFQLGEAYIILTDIELISDNDTWRSQHLTLLELATCSPSLIMNLRYELPDVTACVNRDWWQ